MNEKLEELEASLRYMTPRAMARNYAIEAAKKALDRYKLRDAYDAICVAAALDLPFGSACTSVDYTVFWEEDCTPFELTFFRKSNASAFAKVVSGYVREEDPNEP